MSANTERSTLTTASTSLTVKLLTVTAMFTALNVVMSSFGIPVPGGHFYLNDVIIVAAALLLPPLPAFVVGGIGAFLGDFFFYPAPMFVSLVVRGLQAVVISLVAHKKGEAAPVLSRSIIGTALGALIQVVGYSLGRAFIYSSPEYAILKLPFQIAMAVIGGAIGILLVFRLGLGKLYRKVMR